MDAKACFLYFEIELWCDIYWFAYRGKLHILCDYAVLEMLKWPVDFQNFVQMDYSHST